MFDAILQLIMQISTDVFIIGGLIGILFYIFGVEKAKVIPGVCWLLNLLVKVIMGVLVGV